MLEEEFGRYRLRSVIGEGGMGTVYRAYDTTMDRDVAVKVLAAELAAQPGYRERFRREAHAAGKLADPHVIAVHDAGEIDGRLYLVMPVVEGTDVASVLASEGRLDPQRAVAVIEQLASALDTAHAAGLVHRDVKPSNTLLTRRDFVYLIDFGIVQDGAADKMTRTGALMGTSAYMAPERFVAGRADARSDIYALTCVLYECLTGVTPYPGSLEQQIAGHLTAEVPVPGDIDPALASFDQVISTGMAKDPGQRYDSALALAVAARAAIAAPNGGPPARAPTVVRAEYETERPATIIRPETALNPVARQDITGSVRRAPGDDVASRRGWAIAAAIMGSGIIAVAGVLGYLALTRHSPVPEHPSQVASASTPEIGAGSSHLPGGAIDGLLLSIEQIDSAMGTGGMSVVGAMSNMSDNSFALSDVMCLPLSAAVQAKTYQGSGYIRVAAEVVAKEQQSAVNQAVVEFPSADVADRFFARSRSDWQSCSDRTFTLSAGGNSQVQAVGPVSDAGGMLRATVTPANSPGTCERALTVVAAFAVDVTACAGPAGAAAAVARQIAANVSAR